MGNANTHERRKSGVPETGLTIENIREKPLTEDVTDRAISGSDSGEGGSDLRATCLVCMNSG